MNLDILYNLSPENIISLYEFIQKRRYYRISKTKSFRLSYSFKSVNYLWIFTYRKKEYKSELKKSIAFAERSDLMFSHIRSEYAMLKLSILTENIYFIDYVTIHNILRI